MIFDIVNVRTNLVKSPEISYLPSCLSLPNMASPSTTLHFIYTTNMAYANQFGQHFLVNLNTPTIINPAILTQP